MTSIICALSKNRGIGRDNKLLWKIPEDLKRFKELTNGHPIVMGRKTFESIGRPLPGRTNIVITRDPSYRVPGCIIAHSLEEGLEEAEKIDKEEIFVIGGGEIYKLALPLADKLYLTVVEDSPDADTFFPDYSEFKEVSREEHQEDLLKYAFVELVK